MPIDRVQRNLTTHIFQIIASVVIFLGWLWPRGAERYGVDYFFDFDGLLDSLFFFVTPPLLLALINLFFSRQLGKRVSTRGTLIYFGGWFLALIDRSYGGYFTVLVWVPVQTFLLLGILIGHYKVIRANKIMPRKFIAIYMLVAVIFAGV